VVDLVGHAVPTVSLLCLLLQQKSPKHRMVCLGGFFLVPKVPLPLLDGTVRSDIDNVANTAENRK
jgi:hypothetical protein